MCDASASRACRRVLLVLAITLLAGAFSAQGKAGAAGPRVDLNLVLGIDISNSVDWYEYRLQRRGLAFAIRQRQVVAAIRSGPSRRIGLTIVQWSGDGSQKVAVPWTMIATMADAVAMSQRVADMERLFGGHATHISGMIAFGARLLQESPFVSYRKVIDISGDGHDNVTKQPGRRRDEAVAAGVVINGLAIENEEKALRFYYRDFVIGGPGAFVIQAKRYRDFGQAMKHKLIREISMKLLTWRRTPRRLIEGQDLANDFGIRQAIEAGVDFVQPERTAFQLVDR